MTEISYEDGIEKHTKFLKKCFELDPKEYSTFDSLLLKFLKEKKDKEYKFFVEEYELWGCSVINDEGKKVPRKLTKIVQYLNGEKCNKTHSLSPFVSNKTIEKLIEIFGVIFVEYNYLIMGKYYMNLDVPRDYLDSKLYNSYRCSRRGNFTHIFQQFHRTLEDDYLITKSEEEQKILYDINDNKYLVSVFKIRQKILTDKICDIPLKDENELFLFNIFWNRSRDTLLKMQKSFSEDYVRVIYKHEPEISHHIPSMFRTIHELKELVEEEIRLLKKFNELVSEFILC